VTQADGTLRFHYRDPLGRGKGSFLEAGRNLAGVSARMEDASQNILSVSAEELERVLTAILYVMPNGWTRQFRKSYQALLSSDLFRWFHLSEVGREPATNGLVAVNCKTENFRVSIIGLQFLLDSGGVVSSAALHVDADWARQNILLAGELAASL